MLQLIVIHNWPIQNMNSKRVKPSYCNNNMWRQLQWTLNYWPGALLWTSPGAQFLDPSRHRATLG